jgi:hypothetical protein
MRRIADLIQRRYHGIDSGLLVSDVNIQKVIWRRPGMEFPSVGDTPPRMLHLEGRRIIVQYLRCPTRAKNGEEENSQKNHRVSGHCGRERISDKFNGRCNQTPSKRNVRKQLKIASRPLKLDDWAA